MHFLAIIYQFFELEFTISITEKRKLSYKILNELPKFAELIGGITRV